MKAADTPDVDSTFQRIKGHALASMRDHLDGTGPIIMVGTATCGKAAGALEVLQAIRDDLAQYQPDAHVVEVGCMGHCYAEPLVIINIFICC